MQAAKADKTAAAEGVGLAKTLCCQAQFWGPVRQAVSKL
jgi:hypothetical protein